MKRPQWLALLLVLVSASELGCRHSHPSASARGQEGAPASQPPIPSSSLVAAESHDPPPRPLRRCFPNRPPWEEAPVADLLDGAGKLFDADDFDGALACSEEAARQAPRSVEAHHDRAAALLHLGRIEEARDALALALSLD